ncbi:hypothetical protein JCM1841_003983 [Sporobolomyces salmonicolor]
MGDKIRARATKGLAAVRSFPPDLHFEYEDEGTASSSADPPARLLYKDVFQAVENGLPYAPGALLYHWTWWIQGTAEEEEKKWAHAEATGWDEHSRAYLYHTPTYPCFAEPVNPKISGFYSRQCVQVVIREPERTEGVLEGEA